MDSLEARVLEDVRNAMRNGDVERRDALRLLHAALKNEPIDRVSAAIQTLRSTLGREPSEDELRSVQAEYGRSLTDDEELAILTRLVKRHRDSIDQFRRAGREDLVAHEEAQLSAIQSFMPSQLGTEAIAERVRAAIAEVGASSRKDMGKVMGRLADMRGRADMAEVSRVVQSLLPQ